MHVYVFYYNKYEALTSFLDSNVARELEAGIVHVVFRVGSTRAKVLHQEHVLVVAHQHDDRSRAYLHTETRVHAHTYKRENAYLHTLTRAHARVKERTHICTQTHTHAHTHKRENARSLITTHRHTQTRVHAHTRKRKGRSR